MTASPHRTLIVANRTAQTPVLMGEVERRAAERPTEFTLLIPNVTSRKAADWTLGEALVSLRKAARGPLGLLEARVEGRLGGRDSYASIEEAVAEGSFDEIIISTLPKRRSEWLRRELPARVERLGLPVTVVADPGDPRSFFERFVTTVPPGG